jgi:hypothetical protein
MVTAPAALILSKVALEAIAPCAQTSAETTNAALIPDTRNDDVFIFNPSFFMDYCNNSYEP